MILDDNFMVILVIIILLILLYRITKKNIIVETEGFESYKISESQKIGEPKIAFLFLTYNNLKRPDIWNKFFAIDTKLANETKSIDNTSDYSNKFSIYLHAKDQDKVTDILLKDKHIPEHIDTCWGCANLVEANTLLMKAALKDPLNKKFILVSDSCAPIVTFDKLYKELMKDDKSRVNFWKDNKNFERYDQIIDPPFPISEFKKHSGSGGIYNRTHSDLLVSNLNLFKTKWSKVHCTDEHYFGNILRVLDSNFNNNLDDRNTTFDMWQTDKISYANLNSDDIKPDHYINIKKMSNKAIDRLREHDFMLTRKIDKDTEIDVDYILS
jgi:hypothetical protein